MKIYDQTGNQLQYPFMLGEKGRGREYENVREDRQIPPTTDEVGYKTFVAGDRHHVVLTRDLGQKGILLRINTRGTYTKNSSGDIQVIYGNIRELVRGTWADGLAGHVNNGPDALFHIDGTALFKVYLSGGAYKGYGKKYLFVDTKRNYIRLLDPLTAIQDIATDEDPRLREILEDALVEVEYLPNDLQDAMVSADLLDNKVEDNNIVKHYLYGWSLNDLGTDLIRIPPKYSGGFSHVESGILIPGDKSLVVISIGPGGGKRYSCELQEINGLDILISEKTSSSQHYIFALVNDFNWDIKWNEYKDGELINSFISNAEKNGNYTW
jgi:hypothetical protein